MFECFGELAPELRQSIWKAFLEHRFDDFTIEPHKQLVSPLLSVNQESRGCALRFYTTRFDVHAYPSTEVFGKEYAHNYIRFRDYPSSPRIGSLYLNPSKDILVVNYYIPVRDAAVRYDPAAVSAVTHERCTTPQVYCAPIKDLGIFQNVISGISMVLQGELGDRRPGYVCLNHSIPIWDNLIFPGDSKRHLALWRGGPWKMKTFIDDIYLLDGEVIWGKYKIREFAWSLCKTGVDGTEPIIMLVETPELISSTHAVATVQFHGRNYERNCMVLDDEQAAAARKASCIMGHPLGGDDNSFGTNDGMGDNSGVSMGGSDQDVFFV
ncbi:hypothetical protein PG985_014545 [Apiospora marii]|uniref:2EXR domain-containing protein n=1 Tax=Apiospora marii TaxID=335849 RepID=A0ABR1R4V6_9PEZI